MGSCFSCCWCRDGPRDPDHATSTRTSAGKGDGAHRVLIKGPPRFQLFSFMQEKTALRPTRRRHHCAYLDGNTMVVFGGSGAKKNVAGNGHGYSTIWLFDLLTMRWTHLPNRLKCSRPTGDVCSTMLPVEEGVLTFTGNKMFRAGTCHIYNIRTGCYEQFPCTGDVPPPDSVQQLSYDVDGSHAYLLAPGGVGSMAPSQVYSLSLPEGEWKRVAQRGHPPSNREGAGIISFWDCFYVVLGKKFGGEGVSAEEIHKFSYDTCTWDRVPCEPDPTHGFPRPRCYQAVASNSSYAVMCGGKCSLHTPIFDNPPDWICLMGDVWRLDFLGSRVRWTKLPMNLKRRTASHVAVLSESHCLCVFGGISERNKTVVRDSHGCCIGYVGIPSLAEMAWRNLILSQPHLMALSAEKLGALGVPARFLDFNWTAAASSK
ncbi:kelch domain-containing protein 10-like [Sycon ciliatum]|uniref:kelch domain-containing protein 10-like n=1 Tax=Sycon ciliatum TaxID=27933 RepID=UPI0031F66A39